MRRDDTRLVTNESLSVIFDTNRVIVTPTPRMVISSLTQYDAGARSLSSSVRLRWEYRPGSEPFLVYSDGRDTHPRGVPEMLNRSVG